MDSVKAPPSNDSEAELRKRTDSPEIDLNSVLHLIISRSGVQQKIHIKDVIKTEKLIEDIIEDGPDALQVIADFDATLSCYHSAGKKCETSYGVLQNSRLTPEDVKVRGAELFKQYHPIEIDSSISAEEKALKMVEWYERKHDNYVTSSRKLKSTDITEMVKEAHLDLRDGSDKVLGKLHSANIPTLVFSAGSGNVVEGVLKLRNVFHSNTKVISNFMEFDENTKELVRFRKPVVHPGNKNEAALHGDNGQYFDKLKCRNNVILLGDTIGDTTMAKGVSNPNAILKIGYLNFNFDQQLESFKDAFDIVLVDDQTVHFVDALLDIVLKS
ncbi:7-methylguanosine phosphate-specific 5'-nucleotidase [Orchesella cincta]|uniref:5'-nucleotidase n=1 Tax=Orchesella cincta TaxID=48709 RepID=A0A1D2NIR2_ORCCI|nr:7-methylguanosine phosphate-specific 5'-nucleotidase [Orchesella cincta]